MKDDGLLIVDRGKEGALSQARAGMPVVERRCRTNEEGLRAFAGVLLGILGGSAAWLVVLALALIALNVWTTTFEATTPASASVGGAAATSTAHGETSYVP